jgi:hypothetical protein
MAGAENERTPWKPKKRIIGEAAEPSQKAKTKAPDKQRTSLTK